MLWEKLKQTELMASINPAIPQNNRRIRKKPLNDNKSESSLTNLNHSNYGYKLYNNDCFRHTGVFAGNTGGYMALTPDLFWFCDKNNSQLGLHLQQRIDKVR